MMKRLQAKYAEKPVRFVLVPCNQFGAQEPGSNEEVKHFANQFVEVGAGSKVTMLAKSNVNGVPCDYEGADACTASSTACCPLNDDVYADLLAHTAPGKLHWNFDKIFVGKDGIPFAGESVMHGDSLDAEVSAVIDRLLLEGTEQQILFGAAGGAALSQVGRGAGLVLGLVWVVTIASVAVGVFKCAWGGSQQGSSSGHYIRVDE